MKILIVGSGAREHALGWKISKSPRLSKLYCAPGNAGTSTVAKNIPISSDDIEGLVSFACSENIDLTIVGPEGPLVEGVIDRLEEMGQLAFGPSRKASLLEGSKVFAKNFMRKYGIPSAKYQTFNQARDAESSLRNGSFDFPVVVKADGLAAGKGVFICSDLKESLAAVDLIMRQLKFGASGEYVIVEEFLEGDEVSFMVLTDGERLLPLAPSQDHKAAYDGDRGPNTGGMGAYSVDTILSEEQRHQILEQIITPTIKGMTQEKRCYAGVLYAGLMLTKRGPKVLEFNVRFGDPETQVVLPRIQNDLLPALLGVANKNLRGVGLEWNADAVAGVVLAAGGYPGPYVTGKEISGLQITNEQAETVVFHAGTALKGDRVITNGGRVLSVTARGVDLEASIVKAYEGVNKIHFKEMHYRKDIGFKGLRKEFQ